MTSSRLTIAPHRPADPPPQRKENMTTHPSKEEQEFAIENAEECLMDIETLDWKMPLGGLADYAHHNNLHLAVVGLAELQAAKAVLIDRGPDLLHALIEDAKRQQHTP